MDVKVGKSHKENTSFSFIQSHFWFSTTVTTKICKKILTNIMLTLHSQLSLPHPISPRSSIIILFDPPKYTVLHEIF